MSDPLGSYTFLPWLRRGIATEVRHIDGAANTPARPTIPVTLTFNDDQDFSATANLTLGGPGEITGLDRRVVIRTWPQADVFDAEPNLFAMVEFAQADLPWRYTPAIANPEQRLRPWMCLIALAQEEIESYVPANPDRPLAVVKVKDASSLPKLDQSWAWAHAQVSGEPSFDHAKAADLLANEPARVVSRLLSPRRLDPRTPYRAFVVPTFEHGRRRGLGDPVTEDEGIDGMAPAWVDGQAPVELPVYYEWRFQTSKAADFEYLARLIKGAILPKTVGIRKMDVSQPGAELPPAAALPLGLEGALKTNETETTPWGDPHRSTFTAKLRDLLNLPAELLRSVTAIRVIGPPLYGQWHAGRETLVPDEQPRWFQELNEDPRVRVTAGLGTMVVRSQQSQLMASAWNQVEKIRELNEELRRAQLAREVAGRIYDRHIAVQDVESALQVTAPLHARVRGSTKTIQSLLRRSPIAPGTFEPQLRRVARPLGPIGRRQGRPGLPRTSTVLGRMNRGEFSPAPPPPTADTMVTPSRAGASLVPGWIRGLPAWARRIIVPLLKWLPLGLLVVGIFALLAAVFLGLITGAVSLAVAIVGVGLTGLAGSWLLRRPVSDTLCRIALREGTLTAEQVREAPLRRDFLPADLPLGGTASPQPSTPPTTPTEAESPSARAFRTAAADLFTRLRTPPAPVPPLQIVSLDRLHTTLVRALDPRVTVAASYRHRLRFAPNLVWKPEDELESVMAAPDFPQPMYEPLRDLSQDWLLPGLDQVPPNSASLLLTNQRFVEPYMAGLSHEMARELLWNEYPTDRRGTYFRQFWDVSGYIGRPGETIDPETLKDIKPIHTWNRTAGLGANTSRRPPPGGEHLVLLVRGELLRRYPNTLVYAVKAKRASEGRRVLDDTSEEHPVFEGTLKPDVSFFGFELTVPQVLGNEGGGTGEGWFFVLQEQPAEPKFGLDLPDEAHYSRAPETWDHFSWAHLATDAQELNTIKYINLSATLPDTEAAEGADPSDAVWHADGGAGPRGSHASDIAYITLQKPVRVAIHASQMLRSTEGGSA